LHEVPVVAAKQGSGGHSVRHSPHLRHTALTTEAVVTAASFAASEEWHPTSNSVARYSPRSAGARVRLRHIYWSWTITTASGIVRDRDPNTEARLPHGKVFTLTRYPAADRPWPTTVTPAHAVAISLGMATDVRSGDPVPEEGPPFMNRVTPMNTA